VAVVVLLVVVVVLLLVVFVVVLLRMLLLLLKVLLCLQRFTLHPKAPLCLRSHSPITTPRRSTRTIHPRHSTSTMRRSTKRRHSTFKIRL
jgi:hypothetical protein